MDVPIDTKNSEKHNIIPKIKAGSELEKAIEISYTGDITMMMAVSLFYKRKYQKNGDQNDHKKEIEFLEMACINWARVFSFFFRC